MASVTFLVRTTSDGSTPPNSSQSEFRRSKTMSSTSKAAAYSPRPTLVPASVMYLNTASATQGGFGNVVLALSR